MTAKTVPEPEPAHDQVRVQCRRIHKDLMASEHRDCPYCFGTEETVRSCGYATFCDFEPEKDPLAFGFPDAFGRYGTNRPK